MDMLGLQSVTDYSEGLKHTVKLGVIMLQCLLFWKLKRNYKSPPIILQQERYCVVSRTASEVPVQHSENHSSALCGEVEREWLHVYPGRGDPLEKLVPWAKGLQRLNIYCSLAKAEQRLNNLIERTIKTPL